MSSTWCGSSKWRIGKWARRCIQRSLQRTLLPCCPFRRRWATISRKSLFAQQRNLILEGLTDFWYLEATSELLRLGGVADLNDKIALISANAASKVVYFATILNRTQPESCRAPRPQTTPATKQQHKRCLYIASARNAFSGRWTLPPRPVRWQKLKICSAMCLFRLPRKSWVSMFTAEVAATPDKPLVDVLTRKGGAEFLEVQNLQRPTSAGPEIIQLMISA